MAARKVVLLASFLLFSSRANATFVRGASVCVHCPALPGLTLTSEYDQPVGLDIDCRYKNSNNHVTHCAYVPATGSLMTSISSSSGCPASCCAAGYTFGPGASGCVKSCPAGQYSHNGGCSDCPADHFSAAAGATQCSSCPGTQTAPAGSTSCTTHCAPGTFISGTSCSACPAGYSSGADATACSPCGPNTYSTNGVCATCPPGTSSGAASSVCSTLSCSPGTFIDGNKCTACAPGSYGDGTSTGSCPACLANEFSDGTSACAVCADGTSSQAGSLACDSLSCDAGTFIDGHKCTACAPGSYGDGTTTGSCLVCSANHFSDGTNPCITCPDGTSSEVGSASCGALTCTSGQFLSGNFCGTCSAGTFSAAGDSSCTPCAANSFSNADGASACTTCPSGTKSAAGSTSCVAFQCAAGEFIDGSKCSPCAAGTKGDGTSTQCSICPANKFSAAGASHCTSCPQGQSSIAGSASCATHCPAGKYITGTTCTSCSPGTFASGADSAVCAACPEDTWSEYGATVCKSCESGFGCERGSGPGQCQKKKGCPPGEFHLGTKCYDCPRNFYGAGGFAGCLPCPRGKQSSPGSATCTASPSPSHRHTRAAPQEVMACPAFQQLCPVMTGSKSFECVDTQSSLESCGGCVGAMPSTGQDCSVIPNVNAVSCSMGRCVVTECRKNYVVSAEGDSCVKKTKGHRKRGYFF